MKNSKVVGPKSERQLMNGQQGFSRIRILADVDETKPLSTTLQKIQKNIFFFPHPEFYNISSLYNFYRRQKDTCTCSKNKNFSGFQTKQTGVDITADRFFTFVLINCKFVMAWLLFSVLCSLLYLKGDKKWHQPVIQSLHATPWSKQMFYWKCKLCFFSTDM